METLWERIKQGVMESATLAAEKAEHLGRLGRAHLDIAETRHSIHEAFAELGGAVYGHLTGGKEEAVDQQPVVQDIVRKIQALEIRLLEREARLQTLKAGEAPKAEQTGSTEAPPTP
jgi:hypothetical protein